MASDTFTISNIEGAFFYRLTQLWLCSCVCDTSRNHVLCSNDYTRKKGSSTGVCLQIEQLRSKIKIFF